MFSYIWPIALVVLSNVVYQICAKSTPRDIDPLASLTVTYAVGAIASAILYYVTNKGGHPDLYDRPVFHQSLNINMSKNSWRTHCLSAVFFSFHNAIAPVHITTYQ